MNEVVRGFKQFAVDISKLSGQERRILDKLVRAAELIAPLYEEQKNPRRKGANFYPGGIKRSEIEKAAKQDPKIFHPYTFVEKGRSKKLKTVPFNKKFKGQLKRASRFIKEASRISKDKIFNEYLSGQASALLKNNYAQNEILWATNKPSKINFIIGPIERYLDNLFFKKCAYQAWVGILDKERTEKAEKFRDIILNSRRKILAGTEKITLPRLRIEVNQTLCFSGLIADNMFAGTNLPNSPELMRKYGSKLIIFLPPLELNFRDNQYPIFENFFDKNLQGYFSPEELEAASFYRILLHEISHSLIRYEDAEERLKELFPVFDELLAYILGIRNCGLLLLKNVLKEKELEAIITAFFIINFWHWIDAQTNSAMKHYATGGAIAQNFFSQEGVLKRKEKRLCVSDLTKLFISISHLSQILEYHLSTGSYEEAKEFVDRYGSSEIFEKFSPGIKKRTRERK